MRRSTARHKDVDVDVGRLQGPAGLGAGSLGHDVAWLSARGEEMELAGGKQAVQCDGGDGLGLVG